MRRALISSLGRVLTRLRSPVAVPTHLFAEDEPLGRLPALLLDSETTGLNVMRDRLISVAGLYCRGVTEETPPPLDLLLNPGIRIPRAATQIHGIDDAMVAAAPLLPLLWDGIQASWQGRVAIGHNIAFDLAILRHEAQRHRLAFHPPSAALDIGLLYAGLKPRLARITLENIAADFDIPLNGRHTALGDARLAADIWRQLLPALGRIGVATLGDAQRLMLRQRDLLHGQDHAGWAVDILRPR